MKKPKRKLRSRRPAARTQPVTPEIISRIVERAVSRLSSQPPPENRPPTSFPSPVPPAETPADFSRWKVLVVTSLSEQDSWKTEHLITEQLRLLTREVMSVKCFSDLSAAARFEPHLVLVLSEGEPLQPADLQQLAAIHAVKAAWFSPGFKPYDSAEHVSAFHYVFTQDASLVAGSAGSWGPRVHYLPYAADRDIFRPLPPEERYVSDLLLIGITDASCLEAVQTLRAKRGLRVRTMGETAWKYDGSAEEEKQRYYNGARLIINSSSLLQTALEVAACGAPQIVKLHPQLHRFLTPGEDVITFGSAAELSGKLQYYLDHPDETRMVASRALWGSTYRYSFLQLVFKLLCTVAHSDYVPKGEV